MTQWCELKKVVCQGGGGGGVGTVCELVLGAKANPQCGPWFLPKANQQMLVAVVELAPKVNKSSMY